jgi:hypothetical protein
MKQDAVVGQPLKLWGNTELYQVKYVTNPNRALIDFGADTLVAVDRAPNGTWDLSADRLNAEETAFLESQPDFGKTTVAVVKDEA